MPLIKKPLIFIGKLFNEVSWSGKNRLEKDREELLALYHFPCQGTGN
ncbi:MAG: hypothetical protein ACTS73_09295 [Arsenophonus sp. NEOnobi-MAG3]